RNIGRIVLAVAIHRQDTTGAASQGFAEAGPQGFALAAALGMANQRHRHLRDDARGVVGRAIVDHDHVAAVRQHAVQQFPYRECLVEAGHHHEWAGGCIRQGSISISSDNPDDNGRRRFEAFAPASNDSSARASALAGLSRATTGHVTAGTGSASPRCSARFSRTPSTAPGCSNSAMPNASVVRVISASGPVEATSHAANNTGVSSAQAKAAASSSPAAKLRWWAVTALDAPVQPVAIVQ